MNLYLEHLTRLGAIAKETLTPPRRASALGALRLRGRGRYCYTLLTGRAVFVSVLFILTIAGCSRPNASNLPPLRVIATIPEFSLTESRDRTIGKSDLLGHVWVANFVFVDCSGPCPTLSLRMRSIQEDLREKDPKADTKLVTFTLDPEHDTPQVLRKYADKHNAEANRWWFLTGADQDPMHKLVKEGFLQSVQKATANEPIIHSTYFVLIDRKAQVRAVYDGLDPKSKELILRDIDRLNKDPE